MELIDGVFHQLSKDNTLVAITVDYPGLIPASGLLGDRNRSLIPLREIPLSRIPVSLTTTVFCRGDFRGRRPNLRRLANEGPQGPVGQKGM